MQMVPYLFVEVRMQVAMEPAFVAEDYMMMPAYWCDHLRNMFFFLFNCNLEFFLLDRNFSNIRIVDQLYQLLNLLEIHLFQFI